MKTFLLSIFACTKYQIFRYFVKISCIRKIVPRVGKILIIGEGPNNWEFLSNTSVTHGIIFLTKDILTKYLNIWFFVDAKVDRRKGFIHLIKTRKCIFSVNWPVVNIM